MVDILNGEDRGPLAEWCIVCAHGHTMIGKSVLGIGGISLEPVYELTCVMQMVQQSPRHPTQLMTVRQASPFLTFPSIKRVSIPDDAIIVACEQLTHGERLELHKAVSACEQLIGAMRAADAGLVVAPAGTRLPPVMP